MNTEIILKLQELLDILYTKTGLLEIESAKIVIKNVLLHGNVDDFIEPIKKQIVLFVSQKKSQILAEDMTIFDENINDKTLSTIFQHVRNERKKFDEKEIKELWTKIKLLIGKVLSSY